MCHVTKVSLHFLTVFFYSASHCWLVHIIIVPLVELLVWLGAFVYHFRLHIRISRINPLNIIPLFNLFFNIHLDLSLLLLNYLLEVGTAFGLVHEVDVLFVSVEGVREGVALGWAVQEAGGGRATIYWWLKAFAVSWAGFDIVFLCHATIRTFSKSRQL